MIQLLFLTVCKQFSNTYDLFLNEHSFLQNTKVNDVQLKKKNNSIKTNRKLKQKNNFLKKANKYLARTIAEKLFYINK